MKLSFTAIVAIMITAILCAASDGPVNPFAKRDTGREDARPAVVQFSDGSSVEGLLYLTRGKKFSIFERATSKRIEMSLKNIERIDVAVEEEGMHTPFKFKESADWTKVPLEEAYPYRIYVTTITLVNGEKIAGDLSSLIYLKTEKETVKFILYKRNKGEPGQTLDDLRYIRTIMFGEKKNPQAGENQVEGEPDFETLSTKDGTAEEVSSSEEASASDKVRTMVEAFVSTLAEILANGL